MILRRIIYGKLTMLVGTVSPFVVEIVGFSVVVLALFNGRLG